MGQIAPVITYADISDIFGIFGQGAIIGFGVATLLFLLGIVINGIFGLIRRG